jgi:hypothetical protein
MNIDQMIDAIKKALQGYMSLRHAASSMKWKVGISL